MTNIRRLTVATIAAFATISATGLTTAANAGPFSGIANSKTLADGESVQHRVHYRKKYHKYRHYRAKRRYHPKHRRYRRRDVHAPYTYVSPGRRVIVDAPYANVYVGRGVRVRAPYVDLWIPSYRRYYGGRYW